MDKPSTRIERHRHGVTTMTRPSLIYALEIAREAARQEAADNYRCRHKSTILNEVARFTRTLRRLGAVA